MPYANNRNYNTRNSGRFNTGNYNSGQCVPSGELSKQSTGRPHQMAAAPPLPPTPAQPLPKQQANSYTTESKQFNQNQTVIPINTQTPVKNETLLEPSTDVDMSGANARGGGIVGEDGKLYPPWMKSRMWGVKKISNKERRRRQNENLRRLLTPKNALMVLNEMMPREQLANQLKVETVPAAQQQQYYGAQCGNSYTVDLQVEGRSYKAVGENKLQARNNAAELAIRDIIIDKMTKALAADASALAADSNGEAMDTEGGAGEGEAGGDTNTQAETLPMIQLASFALHKLFSEWEYEGYKVPQLKIHSVSDPATAPGSPAPSSSVPPAAPAPSPAAPAPAPSSNKKSKSKVKVLPLNARSMHPAMLLTYMRPRLEYRQLALDGETPQSMLYTMGVEVDGFTYIGKAANKREARKAAAMAACQQIFGIQFDPHPTANAPVVAVQTA